VLIGLIPGVKRPMLNVSGTSTDANDHDNIHKDASGEIVMEVQTRKDKRQTNLAPLIVPQIPLDNISKADFISEQNNCPTIKDIRSKMTDENIVTVKSRSVKYEKINDLIYRVCTNSKHEYEVGKKQLVVPNKFRRYVLSTAHDSSVSGHFSHRKTSEKIFHKFYWPGAGADIKRYCRSCPSCQKSSAKGNVRKVPLVSMPIISEPFSRVAIDLVGPLNASARGHKYILTMIDCATRFPEAVPLRNIDTVTVAENLMTIFARVGIPREILSDRGTQFKSDLMSEIHRLLSVRAIFTSPYHACCNGKVERFHAVLKSMLRKLCIEQPHDWDRYIPSVLFAYREIPNDTLKFSPFELLYGRKVRGPLTVLHELWTNENLDSDVKSLYQYVLDLRTRLEESAQLTSSHANINSKLYKAYFDRSAKARILTEGDEVLVLLPSTNNKLTMQWKGPYKVIKRHESGVDYLVKVRGKVKLYHINMMKKYIRRENENTTEAKVCQLCVIDNEPDNVHTCDFSVLEEKDTKVNICKELTNSQIGDVEDILAKNADIFSNEPGLTSSIVHDIKLTTDNPVHCKPYPIPHHLKEIFDAEVKRMLDLGVIEQSESPYCSPVVLVKKSDGSWRFCVDFRALNDVSVFDAEPMPAIDGALGNFVGDNFFTEIDLCKGYWQIPLSERSKPCTAFAMNKGLMQFTRLPFGLKTACATFIRLIRKVIADLNNIDFYFDNILVHNATWSEHLSDLDKLFKSLRYHGLTAGPSKCYFGYSSINYLGFYLGKNTLQPIHDKVKAILDMPLPKTKKELRSFLGTVSF